MEQIIQAAISGVIGGTITGIAAFAAIRIEIKYLRRDVDFLLGEHNRRSSDK